jgi:hypothetical protein
LVDHLVKTISEIFILVTISLKHHSQIKDLVMTISEIPFPVIICLHYQLH